MDLAGPDQLPWPRFYVVPYGISGPEVAGIVGPAGLDARGPVADSGYPVSPLIWCRVIGDRQLFAGDR